MSYSFLMRYYRNLYITTLLFFSLLSGCRSYSDVPISEEPNVSLGIAYLQQGNNEKARMFFNKAVQVSPKSADSWYAAAYLEEKTGNITLARQYYQHAIEVEPQSGDAHNNYGVFLCRNGQYQAGIKEILFASQLPTYIYRAAAYQNAALCALKIPDPKAAAEYFAKRKMAMGIDN